MENVDVSEAIERWSPLPDQPEYRNPRWANAAHTAIYVEVLNGTEWQPFSATPDDSQAYGVWIFHDAIAKGGIAEYIPPLPMPYELSVSHFWDRMTVEEGDDFDAAMSVATPLKSRKAFNAAMMLQSDSDLFAWVKNVLKGVTTAARADAIMAQ